MPPASQLDDRLLGERLRSGLNLPNSQQSILKIRRAGADGALNERPGLLVGPRVRPVIEVTRKGLVPDDIAIVVLRQVIDEGGFTTRGDPVHQHIRLGSLPFVKAGKQGMLVVGSR